MDDKRFRIEICGGIAAGKTTLSKLINELDFVAVNEEFEVNPFLQDFYANSDLYSFETEISFLLQHYHSIKKTWAKHNKIICDFSFLLDQAYADLTLRSANEQLLFKNIKEEILQQLSEPDLLIYLKCDANVLHERIKARGREMEKGISVEFLSTLTEMLEKQLTNITTNILVIESDKINYVENTAHRQYIIELIKHKIEIIVC